MFRLQRAKNDIIDAALIAACTAAVETCQAPRIRASRRSPSTSLLSSKSRRIARADPPRRISNSRTRGRDRSGNLASQKAPRRRTQTPPRHPAPFASEGHFRCFAHAGLANRFDLLISVPGIGERTAIALLIRMPESEPSRVRKGRLLLGLPFRRRQRQTPLRRAQEEAAISPADVIASEKVSPPPPCPQLSNGIQPLIAWYGRLKIAGKSHKLALVACARKLLIFANTVLTRETPWTTKKPVKIPSN